MTVRVVIKWKPEAPVVAAAAAADAAMAQPQARIQRAHPRLPVNYRFSIYANQAKQRRMVARGINMSKGGALVEAPEPITVGTIVYLKAPELGLIGEATVRHCTAKGSKFRIGLHFPNPLAHCL